MKETYTRKEVMDLLVDLNKKDADRYREQLESNVRKFVQLIHESVDLAWEDYCEALEKL